MEKYTDSTSKRESEKASRKASREASKKASTQPSSPTLQKGSKQVSKTAQAAPRIKRSDCGIASALDLIGDKWTLLIMRDALFFDCRTFADFSDRPERIPTNLLSERLKRLVIFGALEKVAYQSRPQRFEYVPTKLGNEMKPLLKELRAFGDANL